MSTLKIKSDHIFFCENHASSSARGRLFYCYANESEPEIEKAVKKILEKGQLPKTVEVTGKRKMKMKITTYQDDGYWFQSEPNKKKEIFRLFVQDKDMTSIAAAYLKKKKGTKK